METNISPQRLTKDFKGSTALRMVGGFNFATCVIYIILGIFYITYSSTVGVSEGWDNVNIVIPRVAAMFLAMLAVSGIVTSILILRRYTVKALKKWSICYLIVSSVVSLVTIIPVIYINIGRLGEAFVGIIPILVILLISLLVPIYYLVQVRRYHKNSCHS